MSRLNDMAEFTFLSLLCTFPRRTEHFSRDITMRCTLAAADARRELAITRVAMDTSHSGQNRDRLRVKLGLCPPPIGRLEPVSC